MSRREREAAAQKESDYQRWADDGGFTPEPEVPRPEARFPVAAVSVVGPGLPYRLIYRRQVAG